MSNLSVCCVMLTNGRPEMVKRAIRSFKAQEYREKHLLIFDTGEFPLYVAVKAASFAVDPNDFSISYTHMALDASKGAPVGTLRNMANDLSLKSWDCIAHWDSDDWSHPRRIEEQVRLLQSDPSLDVVGYRDMLFWNQTPGQFCGAWFYENRDSRYCLGTSLCYWRKAWERVKFLPMPNKAGATGEEFHWLKAMNALGESSLPSDPNLPDYPATKPRMIASIHGANTQYYGGDLLESSTSWRRVPGWDDHCRKVMEL